MKENTYIDPAEKKYQATRQAHWDAVARKRDGWHGMGGWYHRRIEQIYRFLVSPGQRVLELGSGTGDLLAAVQPAHGVGVDFSEEIVTRATSRHPELEFIQADAHDLSEHKRPLRYHHPFRPGQRTVGCSTSFGADQTALHDSHTPDI